jgi:signal transduction histidine kinase
MSSTAHDRPSAPPRLSVLVGLAALGCVAASVAVSLVAGNEEEREPRVRAALVGWIILAYLTCGLIAWSRRPDNHLGPLMVVAAFGPFLSVLSEASAPLPHTVGLVLRMLPVALFLHVFLAYPAGRLTQRSERIVVAAAYATAVGLGLVQMLLGGFDDANRYGIVDLPGAANVVRGVQAIGMSATSLAAIGILVARRRALGRPLRRSRELLVDSFVLALVLLAVGILVRAFVGSAAEVVVWLVFGMIGIAPIAFLVGLLRERLARASVGELVVELAEDPSPVALEGALARALGDPSLALAYWLPGFESYADLDGQPVQLGNGGGRSTTLIDHDGVRIAALLHDPALLEEPELLGAVTAAAGIALENARLQSELRARLDELHGSRARVIEAGQEERKRLERNLHDGAQQRLVALSLELGMLEKSMSDDPEAQARLDQARREVALSLEELRDIARGLHPAVIGGHGLAVGLESLVARAPVPVDLTVEVEGRLPERFELAAYYLVSESLANVGKHAQATSATIDVVQAGDMLVIEVVDDGVGGADTERGSGLRGLADRVEALDGNLRVWSPAGGGTRLRAEIPCAS